MFTLAPLVRGGWSSREDSMRRALALLLSGIGQNAPRLGGDEADQLESAVMPLWEELGRTKDPKDVLSIATSAVQVLDEYARASQLRYEKSWRMWRDIVRMLLLYVDQTAPPADISSGVLASIHEELESAVRLEEIKALRARIEECVAELAENAVLSAVPMEEMKRLVSLM